MKELVATITLGDGEIVGLYIIHNMDKGNWGLIALHEDGRTEIVHEGEESKESALEAINLLYGGELWDLEFQHEED